jgi:hypothetical protein
MELLSTVFSTVKNSSKPMEINTLEWTAPIEHMHGNWPGEFLKYTDGLMITVNQVMMKTLFLKMFR